MAVKNEYAIGLAKEPKRSWLLNRLNIEQGFYRLCTSYDTFINIVVGKAKGMDKGESECYSQFKKIGAQLLISDDKNFAKAVNDLDKSIKVYNSLHLICWLDILGYLPMGWNSMVKGVYKLRPFQSKDLREAYLEIASKTGIFLDKKKISEKCGLKKILAVEPEKAKLTRPRRAKGKT